MTEYKGTEPGDWQQVNPTASEFFNMERTTIEIPVDTREALLDERLEHESNYGETIDRLLNRDTVPYTTKADVREVVSDMVVLEALE